MIHSEHRASPCNTAAQTKTIEQMGTHLRKIESFKDLIEMLGNWVITVKKISKSGCRENITKFDGLINSFPATPYTPPEIITLRGKIVEMLREKRNYDKDLCVLATEALEAYKKCYDADPETINNHEFSYDDLGMTEVDDF